MNILITGATGFLGEHLTQKLLYKGHRLTLVSSRPVQSKRDGLNYLQLNLTENSSVIPLSRQLMSCDKAFFLAAVLPPRLNHAEKTIKIDQHCAHALALSSCPEAIYLSGLTVFEQHDDFTVDEKSSPSHNLPPYFDAKRRGESLFLTLNKEKTAVKILRINAPYGPGMTQRHVIPTFLSQALQNTPLTVYGNGQRVQQFTWVGDIIHILASIEKIPTGISHFCGPDRVTMKALANMSVAICDSKAPIIFMGEDTNPSCPQIKPDRLEAIWPRAKRTSLIKGLSFFSNFISKAQYPPNIDFKLYPGRKTFA